MMMMLLIIMRMMLVMGVRAEMMVKSGESLALECGGEWKYCEWTHHDRVELIIHLGQTQCLLAYSFRWLLASL